MTELLRLATAGSVDDGKSTLIGRLLYDAKGIFEDQLEAIRRTSEQRGNPETDLALLTDGLRAEREQGITIDVAYRYFATPKRKFIIADTPGHTEYTRNMVTGASNAHVSLILIDARKGVIEQTRRHAFLSSMLGVPHMVVCVNKMDLIDWDQDTYERIKSDYMEFAARLNVHDITFIPISALRGDNVVQRSENMWWYDGSPLLNHLESVYIGSDENFIDPRFPVQYVIRSQTPENPDFRGYAGTVASGVLRPGDELLVLPSGTTSRIASILTADGPVAEAFPPMAVVITLTDDIAVSRGDMLCRPNNRPTLTHGPRGDGVLDGRALPAGRGPHLPAQARHPDGARHGRVAAVPARHQRAAPRRGGVDARAQRDRPCHLPLHRAAAGRRLHDEPGHRQLHRHRPVDQRHGGGRRHPGDRHAPTPARTWCATAAGSPGPSASPHWVRPGGTLLFTGLSGAGQVDPGLGGRGGLRQQRPARLPARRGQPAPRAQRRPRLLRPGPHRERATGRRGGPDVRRVGCRWR